MDPGAKAVYRQAPLCCGNTFMGHGINRGFSSDFYTKCTRRVNDRKIRGFWNWLSHYYSVHTVGDWSFEHCDWKWKWIVQPHLSNHKIYLRQEEWLKDLLKSDLLYKIIEPSLWSRFVTFEFMKFRLIYSIPHSIESIANSCVKKTVLTVIVDSG